MLALDHGPNYSSRMKKDANTTCKLLLKYANVICEPVIEDANVN